jgi:Ulp1 protease family, C-terminal catalytic domain
VTFHALFQNRKLIQNVSFHFCRGVQKTKQSLSWNSVAQNVVVDSLYLSLLQIWSIKCVHGIYDRKKSFLSTAVLDYIIQHTVSVPDSSSAESPDPPPMLGSLGAETFISSMNLTASIKREDTKTSLDWNMYQDHIRKIRAKFKNFLNHNIQEGDVPQRLIMPVVIPPHQIGHFFVACFDFLVNAPKFFVNVCFYDSVERSQKRIHRASNAADVVRIVNSFFNSYILHDSKYQDLHQSDVVLLQCVEYRDCPRQLNGYDCGIFAVAVVVLHLLDRKLVDTTAFTQSDVTEGRNHLARALNARSHVIPDTTSKLFRNCFPLLAWTIECMDVELINSPLSASDVVEVKIDGLKTNNKSFSKKRMKWNGGNNDLVGLLHSERTSNRNVTKNEDKVNRDSNDCDSVDKRFDKREEDNKDYYEQEDKEE